jgi:hypothetical protein
VVSELLDRFQGRAMRRGGPASQLFGFGVVVRVCASPRIFQHQENARAGSTALPNDVRGHLYVFRLSKHARNIPLGHELALVIWHLLK